MTINLLNSYFVWKCSKITMLIMIPYFILHSMNFLPCHHNLTTSIQFFSEQISKSVLILGTTRATSTKVLWTWSFYHPTSRSSIPVVWVAGGRLPSGWLTWGLPVAVTGSRTLINNNKLTHTHNHWELQYGVLCLRFLPCAATHQCVWLTKCRPPPYHHWSCLLTKN